MNSIELPHTISSVYQAIAVGTNIASAKSPSKKRAKVFLLEAKKTLKISGNLLDSIIRQKNK
jgi:hypothetical protein